MMILIMAVCYDDNEYITILLAGVDFKGNAPYANPKTRRSITETRSDYYSP